MRSIACIAAILFACNLTFAQTGSLRTSFGTNGAAITPIGPGADEARNLAVQPDGKIVVVGHASNGTNLDFAVVRYNMDGSLDDSFGGDGIVTTDIAGGDDLAYGVGIQADGKIVVAGDGLLTSYDFTVVRYNADGTLDDSFNGDGIATVDINGLQSDDHVNYMLIQPDGKIVANGYRNAGSNGDFAVIRLNANGSPDAGFGGGDGIVFTDLNGGSEDFSSGVLYVPGGKLIVAGSTGGGSVYDFAAVRYNANGTLDTDFGTNGVVIYSIGGDDHCYASALQADGKIVLVGWADLSGQDDFGTIRLLANGDLDPGFGSGGIVTTNIGPGLTDDQAIGVAIQANGKIILCGNSSNGDFNVVRYNTSGGLDGSFNSTGMSAGDISAGQTDFARKVRLYGHEIYVAGWAAQSGNHEFALAAFENDGATLPIHFAQFIAQRRDKEVVLRWKADLEENVAQYVIEHSNDGKNYTAIGSLAPLNTTAPVKDYSYVDQHPFSSLNYYRLQIRDADGRRQYSKILAIKLNGVATFRLFPNPAKNLLQVQLPAGMSGTIRLQVTDAAGRMVKGMSIASAGNQGIATAIDISTLPKGLYRLQARSGREQTSASFLKE